MGPLGSSPAPGAVERTRRRKHVPLRTCVACRRTLAKRDLIRIVRTPEGTIEIDLKGKRAGRGAYVCHQQDCWDVALKQGGLGRALKASITSEQIVGLRIQLESVVGQDRDPSLRSG